MTYNTPYHNKIRNEVLKKYSGNHWEPTGAPHNVRHGDPVVYSKDMLNAKDDLKKNITNHGSNRAIYKPMNLVGWSYSENGELEQKEHNRLQKILTNTDSDDKVGGFSVPNPVKKVAKSVGKVVAGTSLDILIREVLPDVLSTTLQTAGIPLPLSRIILKLFGKLTRDAIKSKTGVGRYGVGKYEPDMEGGLGVPKFAKKVERKVKKKGPKVLRKTGQIALDLALKDLLPLAADIAVDAAGMDSKYSKKATKKLGENVRKEIKSKTGFGKKSNPWISHVKDYASKNGMTYSQAMRCAMCKSAYRK